jgi:rare lipoprotein A (peptidoglycan hydrolase)
LHTLKIVSIGLIAACLLCFMNLSDSAAGENSGFTKITVSKDAQPSFSNIDFNDIGTMTASWYGPRFHGNLTANGESYNQMALTAAHKSLPFGTVIKVTNLRNGKSVLVRINDRGPFVDGRDLDLSKGTALALGMINRGVIKVRVQQLTFDYNKQSITTLN